MSRAQTTSNVYDLILGAAATSHDYACVLARVDVDTASFPLDEDDVVKREDDPHVTVRYGLHDGADVAPVLAGRGPVTLTLTETRVLVNREGQDVLYVGVESAGLADLHDALGALPHTDTYAGYKPHVTIAYLESGAGAKYAGDDRYRGQTFTIREVQYSDTEGEETVIPLLTPEPRVVRVRVDPRWQAIRRVARACGGLATEKGVLLIEGRAVTHMVKVYLPGDGLTVRGEHVVVVDGEHMTYCRGSRAIAHVTHPFTPELLDLRHPPASVGKYNEDQPRDEGGRFGGGGGRAASTAEWHASLSQAQKYGIEQWSKNSYKDFRRLDAGLGVATMGVKEHYEAMKSALETAPHYEGPAFRGMAGVPDELVAQLQPGGEFELDAMSSFSQSRGQALSFASGFSGAPGKNLLLETKMKTGHDIQALSFNEDEKEVVATRGTKYRITAVKPGRAYTVVQMEEV